MSPPIVRHWITRIGLIGGTALVLAGCPEDAANITEFASAPSWDFPVAGAYLDPAGEASVDNFILAAIDPSVTDAFARTQSFLTSAASFFTCGGDCPAWEFPVRNGSQDTRLPALQDNDATGDLGITPDSIFGDPFAVYTFAGLPANGSFTVTLERLALTVNGDLDHVNNLLNNPDFGGFQKTPDAPDGLTPLGGSPGTTLGSNPYTIGGFTTDAGGLSGFNFFAFDGGGTNDIIETNSLAAFDLPQYNYLVIYDDATGLPVMRAQVGVDLDATGAPINNALAPFPVDPLTPSDVLAAPGGAGRPDVITVTYNGLQDLAGGAEYQAWLLNTGTGSFVPAVGDYNRIKILAEFDPVTGEVIATRDSVVETVTGVSSFVGGNQSDDVGVGFRHQLAVSDATMPGGANDTVGFYTHIILTITESPNPTTLPDAKPFWYWYTDQNGTPENLFDDSFDPDEGATSFGNFNVADPTLSRTYSGEGQGLGGFREDEFSVDISRISRPPVGYQLVGWLIDVNGNELRLPDITGPPPERVELANADVQDAPGITTDNGILDANFRVMQDALGSTWYNTATGQYSGSDLRTFMMVLQPKSAGSGMGPIAVQTGAVPELIIAGQEEEE